MKKYLFIILLLLVIPNIVNASENVEIKYKRDGIEYITNIEPVKTEENNYKIGLWVRDGACRNRNSNIL